MNPIRKKLNGETEDLLSVERDKGAKMRMTKLGDW